MIPLSWVIEACNKMHAVNSLPITHDPPRSLYFPKIHWMLMNFIVNEGWRIMSMAGQVKAFNIKKGVLWTSPLCSGSFVFICVDLNLTWQLTYSGTTRWCFSIIPIMSEDELTGFIGFSAANRSLDLSLKLWNVFSCFKLRKNIENNEEFISIQFQIHK